MLTIRVRDSSRGRSVQSDTGMTILVTGGAGYIGSHMVWELLDRGQDVVVLDNLSTGHEWAVPAAAHLIRGDVGDRGILDRILADRRVSAILHFAGSIVVPDSVSDPLAYYLNNTVNSRELIAAAVSHGVPRFIFSSTAAVYGSAASSIVDESAPIQPESPYGASKAMTEQMLQDSAAAYGLQFGILRYFNVAGADPGLRTGQSSKGATHLIKVAAEAAMGLRQNIAVFGTDYDTPDGTCERDYIHVSDLVRAHSAILDHLTAGGGNLIVNCGYGRGRSVLEVLDAVQQVSGKVLDIRPQDRRQGDVARIVADVTAIRSQLDWTPVYDDLETIVRHALKWEAHLRQRHAA